MIRSGVVLVQIAFFVAVVHAGEKTIVSLRDMSTTELKYAGIEVPRTTTFRIVARGAGGGHCATDDDRSKKNREGELYAYGWILNADTRAVAWEMHRDNTSRSRDDRTFEGDVTLQRGSYEIYFAATTFTYISTFKNIGMNVDHREKQLFNFGERTSNSRGVKKLFEGWFDKWFDDKDVRDEFEQRAKEWGIDISVDERASSGIGKFTPPKEFSNVVLKATKAGENAYVRKSFALAEATTLSVYALGEGLRGDYELVDYGWIINNGDRSRVAQMKWSECEYAGGTTKNVVCRRDVSLPKGEYTVYYVTDNSHSMADWNCAPPNDPLNYGFTLVAKSERDKANFKTIDFKEDAGVVFVKLTKVGDSEARSEAFTLKQDTKVRVYALGERDNNARQMADYALILDARTRARVWKMEADATIHAGGASKNRLVDEVITLPKGSYIVQYNTDDSHAHNDWNSDPPYDQEHYGVTLSLVGEKADRSIVGKYTDPRETGIIAQFIRVRDDEKKDVNFKLDKRTKIRVYALGEGVNREMADWGWITDAKSGTSVWEMTYSMTSHAGGARKNRMVNTTIILDKGSYTLHYETDDSHAFGDWNSDPPEDAEYWGITLYPDDGSQPPVPPLPPQAPKQKAEGGNEE
jgi:hypothetical protein